MLGLLSLAASVIVLAALILWVLPDEEELKLLRALMLVLAVSVVMAVIMAALTPIAGALAAALVALPIVAVVLVYLLKRFCAATIRQAALITGLFLGFQFLWSFLWLIIEAASR